MIKNADAGSTLGRRKMPKGYTLVQLDTNEYIWYHPATAALSKPHANRWAIYHDAWADSHVRITPLPDWEIMLRIFLINAMYRKSKEIAVRVAKLKKLASPSMASIFAEIRYCDYPKVTINKMLLAYEVEPNGRSDEHLGATEHQPSEHDQQASGTDQGTEAAPD